MLKFKEMHGSVMLVEEENEVVKEIFEEITEPAILFDKEVFTLLKIGNKFRVEQYFEESIEKCRKNNSDLFESWFLMDLPKDAEELNRIWHNVGYFERHYKQYFLH